MGAYELHEDDLPAEIECRHQPIVSSRNLESYSLAVEHLRVRRGPLDVVCRNPLRGPDDFVPAFKRNLCFRMLPPKSDKHISGDDPHKGRYHVPLMGTRVSVSGSSVSAYFLKSVRSPSPLV